MTLDIKVPSIGVEGAMEVIEICISVGEDVEQDDSIVVLESDKTTVEVPCPEAGRIKSIGVKVGDKVLEGASILMLEPLNTNLDKKKKNEPESIIAESEIKKSVSPSTKSSIEKALKEVQIPDLGGSEQVEVIEISVSENQEVSEDDTLIVLESDKTTMEIPSPYSGLLTSLKVKLGDKVSAGDAVATILSSKKIEPTANDEVVSVQEGLIKEVSVSQTEQTTSQSMEQKQSSVSLSINVHAGPAVRKLARELGADLSKVAAKGPKGRILKEDLNDYVKQQVTLAQGGGESRHASDALPIVNLPDFSVFGDVERVSMDKIQRLTATNMQTSWLTVPHVTQFDEADITEMEAFRKKQKKAADSKDIKLTPMAFLLKACGYALNQLPQFNVSIDMQAGQLFQKKYIHIGIAVDTPNGLVVPVIRDVNTKNLWELAEECQTLAARARDRKLLPTDMQGGCFTISSLGGLGGTAFTPIVNTPEVAILGVSKAQYKPVYEVETNGFIPKLMLPLSLSYDHRAVNGADAARFTSLLSDLLGDLKGLLL